MRFYNYFHKKLRFKLFSSNIYLKNFLLEYDSLFINVLILNYYVDIYINILTTV